MPFNYYKSGPLSSVQTKYKFWCCWHRKGDWSNRYGWQYRAQICCPKIFKNESRQSVHPFKTHKRTSMCDVGFLEKTFFWHLRLKSSTWCGLSKVFHFRDWEPWKLGSPREIFLVCWETRKAEIKQSQTVSPPSLATGWTSQGKSRPWITDWYWVHLCSAGYRDEGGIWACWES